MNQLHHPRMSIRPDTVNSWTMVDWTTIPSSPRRRPKTTIKNFSISNRFIIAMPILSQIVIKIKKYATTALRTLLGGFLTRNSGKTAVTICRAPMMSSSSLLQSRPRITHLGNHLRNLTRSSLLFLQWRRQLWSRISKVSIRRIRLLWWASKLGKHSKHRVYGTILTTSLLNILPTPQPKPILAVLISTPKKNKNWLFKSNN